MRKYWKFIAIIAVIVLSIGTFYVKSAMSAKQNPRFVIQTLSGDENELKPLVLEGSYTDTSTMSYVSTNLKIGAGSSTYNSRSFLNQMIGEPPIEIKELQEKYRTFMRGKSSDIDSFFESNQYLVYADVKFRMGSLSSRDFKFNISLLSKESGDIDSFNVKIPDSENLEYAYMEDVQMVNDELYLITHHSNRKNGEYYEEKHIYTIDVANQKIVDHHDIMKNPNGSDDTYFYAQLLKSNTAKANDQLIMVNTEMKVVHDKESSREEVVNQEILSYSIATKELNKINLPDLRLDNNQLSLLDGSTAYFMTFEGQELVVTPFSLVDDQVGESYSIKLSTVDEVIPATLTTVKDGKLYIASQQLIPKLKINHADVIIADVNSGEILFKGEIALSDPKANDDYELNLHEMYVN